MSEKNRKNGTRALANPLCARCRQQPPRKPGQRYCAQCHAKASRVYRERREAELVRLRTLRDNLTVNNAATRAAFAARCPTTYVRVIHDPRDPSKDITGEVTAFLPAERLSVMDTLGKIYTIHLNQVEPVTHKWYGNENANHVPKRSDLQRPDLSLADAERGGPTVS